MKLQKAEKKRARIKILLQGAAGSGKTYSSLLLAKGLVSDWNRIAVIDTEAQSSHLYSHLGNYQVLPLEPPFTPERYVKAIKICKDNGIEVIILDSISPEWNEILELHGKMTGNSFFNWAHLTPRHNSFVDAILGSPCHIIATVRSKHDYIISEQNSKMVPEKVGLKAITRDGMDYEFTIVIELALNHQAKISKDRTNLFADKQEFLIDDSTGEKIKNWCLSGTSLSDVISKINQCGSVNDLHDLYRNYPEYQEELLTAFKQRKLALESKILTNKPVNIQSNGTDGN